jgi:hypothetical protein
MTAPRIPEGFTREQLIACVERELRLREHVYPRQREIGRMSQAKCDEELAAMRAVLAVLRQFPATLAAQGSLL